MARRTAEARGNATGKILMFLAVAGFIYWAGRDPSGAAALAHHVGGLLAAAAHGISERNGTHS
jgi:hypothetical protein